MTIISIFGFIITLLVIIIKILMFIRKDTDKIRYYGIYLESSENLMKVFWIYNRELKYSEIIKIKNDYRLFKKQDVVVRELNDYKIAEFTGYNITK
jgi:hypothetical protein